MNLPRRFACPSAHTDKRVRAGTTARDHRNNLRGYLRQGPRVRTTSCAIGPAARERACVCMHESGCLKPKHVLLIMLFVLCCTYVISSPHKYKLDWAILIAMHALCAPKPAMDGRCSSVGLAIVTLLQGQTEARVDIRTPRPRHTKATRKAIALVS